MNNIQSNFTIKDLEHFSGIKAHTIRIWEKRYKLLNPHRTDSNIRYYDLENLQKLLNVSYLYNHGFKISKIAKLAEDNLEAVVQEQVNLNGLESKFIEDMKLSMLRFDRQLFESTYQNAIKKHSFEAVFEDIFMPLLTEIGLLWQSNAINPAHEHFITNLIKHKLLINIESAQKNPPKKEDQLYVLYLPMNEIHELGLLYIHYILSLKGYLSVYLGPSIPMDNLNSLQQLHDNIVYISYFTVKPPVEEVNEYLTDVHNMILKKHKSKLWILGKNTMELEPSKLPKTIEVFKGLFTLTRGL